MLLLIHPYPFSTPCYSLAAPWIPSVRIPLCWGISGSLELAGGQKF